MSAGEFRLRVCYRKAGRLRYLSHLEVAHALERAIRRAELPFAVTEGFSPHMKVAFGPALPVGTQGLREYLDVWLTRYNEASEALAALAASSVEDLAPHEARYVAAGEASLTATLTIGIYRIEIDREETTAEEVHAALTRVLNTGELALEHKGRQKVYDLARSVPKEPRVAGRDGGVDVELAIRMGPHGSLRPEALVRAALAGSRSETSVVRTTRLDALVESDEGVWSCPV